MKRNCPNTTCKSQKIIKNGHFFRANDSRKIQRFRCKSCGKQFSSATGTLEFGQKKRRVNSLLLKLFCNKVSQKAAARIAGVNKVTVSRKLEYWSKKARVKNEKFLKKLEHDKVLRLQFDDLITKEKTKLKPLSVTTVVDVERRYILAANVSQIPAFGHLAKHAKKKYGYRKSFHKEVLDKTFYRMRDAVNPFALIESDEHQNYLAVVRKYFPKAEYHQFKSERASVAGQGELKNKKFDPIFCINHTLAMMRDSISTLVRRSWCTTQCPVRLQGHLDIFTFYYNQVYLRKLSSA